MKFGEWILPSKSLDEVSRSEIIDLIRILLIAIPIAAIAAAIIYILNGYQAIGNLIFIIPLMTFPSLWILNKGYYNIAILLPTLALMVVTTLVAIQSVGIHSSAIVVFPVIVLFSSLTMNIKGVGLVTILVILCLCIITFADRQENTGVQILLLHGGDLIIISNLLIINTFICYRFARIIKNALKRTENDLRNQENIKEEIDQNLKLKKELMRHVHHRVKNSLSLVNSLIEIESYSLSGDKTHFLTLRNNIQTIGRAHDPLYQSEHYIDVAIKPYFEKLISSFSQLEGLGKLSIEIEDCFLFHDKALSLGIILQEFLGLFGNSHSEEIVIQIIKLEDSIDLSMTVKNVKIEPNISDFQTMLIEMLVDELDGKLVMAANKYLVKVPT